VGEGDVTVPTSALEKAGAIVTETSLKFANPSSVTWEQYEEVGQFLGSLGRAYPWWVGDFLNDGEDVFGEKFAQIEAMLPHSPSTCANYKSVAKHVPPSRRRGLHLTVVAEVAYLPPQQRDELLEKASRNGWKREEMRSARQALKQKELPAPLSRCPTCGQPIKEE
jgi:hypothetical protein